MSKPLDPPKLKQGQYSLAFAEKATGIIVKLDGMRYQGSGKVFEIFDSIEEAERHAATNVAKFPQLDCIIFDSTGQGVKFIE